MSSSRLSDVAVHVQGIGKQYHIGAMPSRSTLYERLARTLRLDRSQPVVGGDLLWALKDVSFDVPRGQVFGIVGRNGSGKSTLLRILARITSPTEGTAEMHGRVGALLEVGTGFHPELSGRDNIALSGSILGMTPEQIMARQDAIVDFAEIDQFLDTAVKHYSSGMFLRLAFSVSIHLDADILLVDEVLAVGDGAFQLKCQERIKEAVAAGRTVVFVSHGMDSVLELCDRAMVLNGGAIVCSGTAVEAVDFYTHEILGIEGPHAE